MRGLEECLLWGKQSAAGPPVRTLPPNSPRPRGEGRPMKAVRRRLVGIILLCGLALATGCGDRTPTAPQPAAPSADLIGSLLGGTGLLGCSNLPPASAPQPIRGAGGTLDVGPPQRVLPPG